jgi:hypothetical protein
MLKPLTLSLSLAVAFGACSLSMAGNHGGIFASGQCETPSAQALPSAQGCGNACAPAKKRCNLFSGLHKPKCYTYEWVLKKRRVWGHHGGGNACESCGTGVYPTGQVLGSPQGAWGSGQAGWGSGQAGYGYGTGQGGMGAGQATPATGGGTSVTEPPAINTAPAGTPATPAAEPAAPAAGANPPTASNGGLLFLSPAGN